MTEQQKEKWIKKFITDYTGKCPECKEQGTSKVLPFGDDFFFCENSICKVTRHSNLGYYLLTEQSVKAPNVNYVQTTMIRKRN